MMERYLTIETQKHAHGKARETIGRQGPSRGELTRQAGDVKKKKTVDRET